jgi:hypothetical protein
LKTHIQSRGTEVRTPILAFDTSNFDISSNWFRIFGKKKKSLIKSLISVKKLLIPLKIWKNLIKRDKDIIYGLIFSDISANKLVLLKF